MREATFLTAARDFVDCTATLARALDLTADLRDFAFLDATLTGVSFAGMRINSPFLGESKKDSSSRVFTLTIDAAGAE